MLVIPRRIIHLYSGAFEDILKAFLLGSAIKGGEISRFENALKKFIEAKEVIVVNSGRFALRIILESLELPPGSEIIVPAYTAEEVPRTIFSLGLKPIFIDIKNTDHNMDVSLIESNITKITKVIIATHIFGIPCDIERILEIAQKNSLFIIEDCAHSLGASVNGKKIGNFGIASFFSFSNSKPFNTFGGGAISTNDEQMAKKIRNRIEKLPYMNLVTLSKSICISYFLYCFTKPLLFTLFIHPFIFISSMSKKDLFLRLYSLTFKRLLKSKRNNFKFTNLQAIIGLKQIEYYRSYCYQTKEKFEVLTSNLQNVCYLIKESPDVIAVPYFFVIVNEDAAEVSRYLLQNGIDTGKELMRYCPQYFDCKDEFPVTKKALEKSIQIPIHNFVDKNRLIRIAKLINSYINGH